MLYKCLGIKKGLTSFVGGGGKTSCIYTCAKEIAHEGNKVAIITTTKMRKPTNLVEKILVNPDKSEIQNIFLKYNCICVCKAIINKTQAKIHDISQENIQELLKASDYVLCEADGARMNPIKIPKSYEPVIPKETQLVVGVIGLGAIGKEYNKVCYNFKELENVKGIYDKNIVKIEDIIHIIQSKKALKKDVDKDYTILLNQLDTLQKKDADTLINLCKKVDENIIVSSIKNNEWRKIE